MIPELGHLALILALGLALVQAVLPLWGAARGDLRWMATARPAAAGQFVFVLLAYGCLTYAFVTDDFSVAYVASNSNTALPLLYKVSAVWGSHEGSLLLWLLILCTWTVAVGVFSRRLDSAFASRVLGIMGLISIGFLLFVLATSNPFERLVPATLEGRDLNPLLQDPGMAIHPPMLYMGYVGFSVAFSFAIAALLGGRLDAAWARWSRPWTAVAWVFLTFGITLGSWWAYNELGWGGWWFWDPVENASFMPWLVGTALLHSLAVTEKRDAFKTWTVLLAICAFSLSLLGTFLVRSGVLTSVHAFATDPTRGVFILAFLAVVVGGSLVLYALRAPNVRSTGTFSLFSRETLLLANNVLLLVTTASVLLGTLYPLVMEALQWEPVSVGPPYFALMFAVIMLPLTALMGFGPLVRWKHDRPMRVFRAVAVGLAVSAVVGLVVWIAQGLSAWGVALSVLLAVWIVSTALRELASRFERGRGVAQALRRIPRSVLGMVVAHTGVAVFMIGVACTNAFTVEKDVALAPGQHYEVAGYRFRFEGTERRRGPNYIATVGTLVVSDGKERIARLQPEKRLYPARQQNMTEAAVDVGLFRDLYVALGEPLGQGRWSMRLHYKPFIRWIWGGALIMMLGGLLAACDRRYRLGARARKQAGKPVASEGRA